MRRAIHCLLACIASSASVAQYPVIRDIDVRIAQLRPHVTAIVTGPQGLLWCATDAGVVRTDGVRHLMVLRTAPHAATAIASSRNGVLVATDHGLVVHCRGTWVDTVFIDTTLAATPVRALAVAEDGTFWLGTYGDGLRVVRGDSVLRIASREQIGDRHVNAIVALLGGGVAVATDQGIDILDPEGNRLRRIDSDGGAPDNLVLSMVHANDRIYAGTDRAGVFEVDPSTGRVGRSFRFDGAQPPVLALSVADGLMWMGTDGRGTWLWSLDEGAYSPPEAIAHQRIVSLARTFDGSVWWCDGTDRLLRADPGVLLFTDHEGVDLRTVQAIDLSNDDRIAFAKDHVVYVHSTSFIGQQRFSAIPLPLPPEAQVSSVHFDPWGRIWVGTMGEGALRIDASGEVQRIQGIDDNVLAIRSEGGTVWFATLAGLMTWMPADTSGRSGAVHRISTPGYGFIYDVLPVPGGGAYAATDGNGVLRVDASGSALPLAGDPRSRTFYSLCRDRTGSIWAAGPGTGLCKVNGDSLLRQGAHAAAFEGEVFGLVEVNAHLLLIGSAGLALTPLDTFVLSDPGEALELAGGNVPLNAVRSNEEHSFWVACDKGLMHLRPSSAALANDLPAVITDLAWGDQPLLMDSAPHLGHEQNFLNFGFSASFAGPSELIVFQFQLEGYDRMVRTTQDREVSYARLEPGDYTFKVRGVMPGSMPNGAWTVLRFTISAPWWRTPMATIGLVLLAVLALLLVLRARDQRIRFKDRMEKEKVRFQLEAVRSQVNPHFLFNSFNTLIELIEEDRGKAITHTQQLSDFFRNILQVRDKELISLGEDLVLLENYYQLERRRFGERIMLELRIDEDRAHMLLPPLTLQLLAENAFKHNVATLEEPLVVQVTAIDDWLVVRNAHRPRRSSTRSTGFGLESLRKRYDALTDRPMTTGVEGHEFVVRIPLLADRP